MPGIYIETFGCQMNEADSEYIAERAAQAGYAIVDRPAEAQVLVVNTCTVRDNAETRAYGRINHFKALKEADPRVRLIVAGCLAEQDRDRMQKRAPHVDAVFGTQELARLGDAIAAWRPEFADDERSEEQALLLPLGGSADCVVDAYSHLRAFVTVQRGCSYYCTFCIVPHVRGRFDHRSRLADILADVRARHRRAAPARSPLGRPNRERVPRSVERRRFRRPARDGRASRRARALDVRDLAPERFYRRSSRARWARCRKGEPSLPPPGSIRLEPGAAPHESQVYDRGVSCEGRDVPRALHRLVADDRYHRRIPRRERRGFPAHARDVPAHRLRAGVHVRLFAAARDSGRDGGAAESHFRNRKRAARLRRARRSNDRRTTACSPTIAARSERPFAR